MPYNYNPKVSSFTHNPFVHLLIDYLRSEIYGKEVASASKKTKEIMKEFKIQKGIDSEREDSLVNIISLSLSAMSSLFLWARFKKVV